VKPVEQREDFDCVRCCLATVFECDYEEAPAVADLHGDPLDQWLYVMTQWCWGRGFALWHVGLWGQERPYLKFGNEQIRYVFNPPGYWLAGVQSPRYDGAHSVVMFGDEIVWDPHPQRAMGHEGFIDGELLLLRGTPP
jgi:hypothetical protein